MIAQGGDEGVGERFGERLSFEPLVSRRVHPEVLHDHPVRPRAIGRQWLCRRHRCGSTSRHDEHAQDDQG